MFCSNIVHQDAARGAFATRDYEKGEVIGSTLVLSILPNKVSCFHSFVPNN